MAELRAEHNVARAWETSHLAFAPFTSITQLLKEEGSEEEELEEEEPAEEEPEEEEPEEEEWMKWINWD